MDKKNKLRSPRRIGILPIAELQEHTNEKANEQGMIPGIDEEFENARRQYLGAVNQILKVRNERWATSVQSLRKSSPFRLPIAQAPFHPDNWPETEFESAVAFLERTNWPIIWLPRKAIVKELLDSCSNHKTVLCSRRDELLEDAENALSEVNFPDLLYFKSSAQEMVEVLRNGHDRAAQTFASSILTALLNYLLDFPKFFEVKAELAADWRDEKVSLVRLALIERTIPSTLDSFYAEKRDPVPTEFNRHALAHVLDPVQLTEVNALVGVIFVVSLLREFQELLTEEQGNQQVLT
jgi:hypothetical protein